MLRRIALIAALTGPLCGQIKVDVDVVNVLCTVHDRHGALIANLSKDDFAIREDGTPQEIRYFARETDLPLTVALLVDVSGSVRRFVQSEKQAAVEFFRQVLRPGDQALLTGFSSTLVLWQDFTASVSELEKALAGMHAVPFKGIPADGGPTPTTLLYDAVSGTAFRKLADVSGRKAMVIISDGLDLGSRTNLEIAVRAVQATNTIVYGICYPNPHQSGCEYLRNLSDATGGTTFDLRSNTPLAEIFQRIEDELRSQYSLGFVSANRERDGKFRKLEVTVRVKGLKVEARKGYYSRS